MSRKRKFSYATRDRIEELKQIRMKKTSESKVNWAVKAYRDWRQDRLYNFNYDVGIYEADIDNIESLSKGNLEHALCHFVPEVTKVKGEGPYPGKTLYQLIAAIQKYLNINRIMWRLVDGPEFLDLHNVLDNVMKERTAMNVGVTKRQAGLITYEVEEYLWNSSILGEDSPDKLRDTVLFLIGINVTLRAIEEHYQLQRPMPNEPSQLSFQTDCQGVRCLVYRED